MCEAGIDDDNAHGNRSGVHLLQETNAHRFGHLPPFSTSFGFGNSWTRGVKLFTVEFSPAMVCFDQRAASVRNLIDAKGIYINE